MKIIRNTVCLAVLFQQCDGFALQSPTCGSTCLHAFRSSEADTHEDPGSPSMSRRRLLDGLLKVPIVTVGAVALVSPLDRAVASGGATAGGTFTLHQMSRSYHFYVLQTR